ncbi:MAG: PAS domain-containing sensor histidine kinase [Flammeovirgaceae bacterium]|nr:PAS domain-containing sensor histidine kinase [Flammeovirgaceae bacterium]
MNLSLGNLAIDRSALEQILNFLPYPFLISEFREGTYHNFHVNQKFLDEIGYSCDEIPTVEDWFEHAYPDDLYRNQVISGWTERFEAAKSEGRDYVQMKVIITTKKNGDYWYEVKSCVFGNFQLVAFVNIHEVISKEEELRRLNTNNNQVLSVLAHDLRSPVNTLHSLSELALKKRLTQDEFRELAELLHAKCTQTLDMLDTTLCWAKANFNSISVKREPLPFKSILESILSVYEGAFKSKKIHIDVWIDDKQPVTDPEIVNILVRNLISNSIKFTPEGGSIRISSSWNEGAYYIGVKDSGVGMNSELISKILSYSNASSLGTHNEKGHGIGLQLCQQLVKKINGSLVIESKVGSGTLMQIVLNTQAGY